MRNQETNQLINALTWVLRRGLLTIKTDLTQSKFIYAIVTAYAVDVPAIRQINKKGERELAWVAPDELLGLLPIEVVTQSFHSLNNALDGIHYLVVDVSDAFTVFTLTSSVLDILAKGTPSDMSVQGFTIGEFRRTRIGQIQAFIWLTEEDTVHIMCRRSEATFIEYWMNKAKLIENAPNFFHC